MSSTGLFNQTSPYKINMEEFSHKNNIKRSLSAVMSSPKWLQNNGFNLKKVQSSHQLQALGEDDHQNIKNDHVQDHNDDHDHHKEPAFEDIWSKIQANKKSWGDILSNDGSGSGSGSGSDSGQLPAPYVHPLVRRSASSLSEKSLEICTESLGSETGSDGFSYSSSEPESDDSDKEHEQEVEEEKEKEKEKYQQEVVEVKESSSSYISNCKYNSYNTQRGPTTSKRSMMVSFGKPSFPPPLPSLANRDGGSNLHIRSHRQDGRLVVEAVSVPSQNCFRAQRQDGRLLLTLTPSHEQDLEPEPEPEPEAELVEDDGEDDEKGNDEGKTGIVLVKEYDHVIDEGVEVGDEEEELNMVKEVINAQRSCPTLTMSTKFINKSTWPRDFNKNIIKSFGEGEGEDVTIDEDVAEVTLFPQPRVSTTTAVLNAYEYYWRRQASNPAITAVTMLNPIAGQQNNKIFADAPQVGKDTTKGNNKELLFAAHNTKGGVALAKQEVVLVKAAPRRGGEKGKYLVPIMLRGCKDHKKSFFLFDSYCIATS